MPLASTGTTHADHGYGSAGVLLSWLTDIVPRTALAVLWLAMHQSDVDSMVALTLAEAAGPPNTTSHEVK